jgi:plastocyanin
MANLPPIAITRTQGATLATFAPNPPLGPRDSAFWANYDDQPHQPAPDGGADTAWMPDPIPPAQSAEEPSTSNLVQFSFAGKYDYHCAIHPDEKGVVNVVAGS